MKIQNPHRTVGRILFHKVPIEAQVVVTRRCNLTCGYCTEYDGDAPEVAIDDLKRTIDALHRLGVVNITLLGGEPLLHSRIEDVVQYASQRAQVSITTNGFLLSDEKIRGLNRAGLANMQLSIDAMDTDGSRYVQKTLKPLRPKLGRLAREAAFGVHCNVVLCEQTLRQFDAIMEALDAYPFARSVNLVHDEHGQVQVQGRDYLDKWHAHFLSGKALSFFEKSYGAKLLKGERPVWRCRAGSRYLYIDEFGMVQFCSAKRGQLNQPILSFRMADLRRHASTYKGCESGCSIFCAYRASMPDNSPIRAALSLAESVVSGAFLHGSSMRLPDSGEEPQAAAVAGGARSTRRLSILGQAD